MAEPVGATVPHVEPVPLTRVPMTGRLVMLREPDPRGDAAALYAETHGSRQGEAVWAYLAYGPFTEPGVMADWISGTLRSEDPLWYTVALVDGRPVGMAAMMNADPANRRLELGHIWYVPSAHRIGVNTEAAFLMLETAFTTFKCRRVEWKCDSLNTPSRRAALRLGFAFEGVFRQHMIIKGRNRDTAWYAMTDEDWPGVKSHLVAWLDHPGPKPSLSRMMGLSPE